MPLHMKSARDNGIEADEGDARDLAEPDESWDAVLPFGPLYHLLDRADRVRVFAEARRVVRPGGVVLSDPDGRALLLDLAARTERGPSTLGAAPARARRRAPVNRLHDMLQ
jgi:SAM-dependent methyltransferase